MTFTIEPMITLGSYKAQMWDDGWTATTIDLSRTAQFEHTILVHEHGVELLTVDGGEPQPFMPGNDKTIWPLQVDLKAIGH
jgi:methionine aminopeptidase